MTGVAVDRGGHFVASARTSDLSGGRLTTCPCGRHSDEDDVDDVDGGCVVWMSERQVMAGTGVIKKALPRLRLRPPASRALTLAAECLLPHSRLRHHMAALRSEHTMNGSETLRP